MERHRRRRMAERNQGKRMKQEYVLLDTSFFIRLLNPEDKLHSNATGYFQYFLEHDIKPKISTIALAEFCVKGNITDLPLQNIMVLPFNYDHAVRAGKMMNLVYKEKQKRGAALSNRVIIPNDTKMFAQADVEETIGYYATADVESRKIYEIIKSGGSGITFKFIDINTPYTQTFGMLDFST